MNILKFPRHTQRHGGDWIIDPAFLQRVLHSIDADHPHKFTPSLEEVEATLLALEVIPSNLYTTPPAPAQELTDEQIQKLRHTIDWTASWSYIDFARAIEAAHGITKGN